MSECECDKCAMMSRRVLQTLFGPARALMTCNLGHEFFAGNCEDFCLDAAHRRIEYLEEFLADNKNQIEELEGAVGALKARINRLRIYAETAWTARKRDGSLDNPDYRLYADRIIDDLCDESPAPEADLERENAKLHRQLLESQSEARQSEYRRRRTAESATGQIRKIEYLEELLVDNKKQIEELKSKLAAKTAEDAGQADGSADESRRLYEELLADKNRKIEALESELIGKECDIQEMTETLDARFPSIRQALKRLAMLDPGPESDGGADV